MLETTGTDTGGSRGKQCTQERMFYLMWPAVCVQEDPCMGVLSHVHANKGLSLPSNSGFSSMYKIVGKQVFLNKGF